MPAQTDFRPQIHGFDFNNTWDTDDHHHHYMLQQLQEALPVVAHTIATSAGIGAALVGAMGAAYGSSEVLLPGLLDSIVLPVVVNQIISAVNEKINNSMTGFYGFCGGMAFTSLDYYHHQLVIPKGIYRNGHYIVPPLNVPDAKRLRVYIYRRFEDSWNEGGVRSKMLEWYIVLHTIPGSFGGGSRELLSRSKAEWSTLRALLDQGKPQPLALLFDTWNIFENHQLVAYGYEGDPAVGDAFIFIYDNNHPNKEFSIRFNFTDPEMNAVIIDTDNLRVRTYPLFIKGFFCVNYQPKTPPLGWSLQEELTVYPNTAISTQETYQLSGIATNTFGFFQDPLENAGSRLAAIATDALNLTISPANYVSGYTVHCWNPGPLFFHISISYAQPGLQLIFSKVWMTVQDSNGQILMDREGKPLARIFVLKPLHPKAKYALQLNVIPRLELIAVNYSGNPCAEPFIEGEGVTLMVRNQPFSNDQLNYQWIVYGASTGNNQQEKIELFNLPPAGSTVTVRLTITSLKTGSIATGNLTITTYTGETAAYRMALCKLIHTLESLRIPELNHVNGTNDPAYAKSIQQHIGLINKAAGQITKLSDAIMQANQQGIVW